MDNILAFNSKKVPQPIGKTVLLQYIKPEEETEGGIILPQSVRDKNLNNFRVVAIGLDPAWEPEVKIGDHVIATQYLGKYIEHEGEKYVLHEYKDIQAIVTFPES